MSGHASDDVRRPAEQPAIGDFLTAASTQPAALIIEGEAGIGKSTLWWDALDRARDDGFCVLAARAAQPETVHAFATIGDLLTDVEPSVVSSIPDLQQRALDRVLMRATAGRCCGMWLAAKGDIEGALDVVAAAMVHHERLPMPLEQGRTQLVLGQLHRRRRQKQAAAAALNQALRTFEALGSPLWVDRVNAELARTTMGGAREVELTTTEQQVADLAADGQSNRDIAAAMYISAKTVEAHLSRIYRKLGIHSRAELGRRMDQLRSPD